MRHLTCLDVLERQLPSMAHRAPLIITSYNPSWPTMFREEQRLLMSVLPEHFEVEHIGSTAVPGLSAKPILDVMIGAPSLPAIDAVIPALEELGYEYLPQNEATIPDRRFLAKPLVRPRHFHVHAVALDGRFWREHLLFRDLLRADAVLASEYDALKRSLAERFGDDRAGYTEAKSSFILSAIDSA